MVLFFYWIWISSFLRKSASYGSCELKKNYAVERISSILCLMDMWLWSSVSFHDAKRDKTNYWLIRRSPQNVRNIGRCVLLFVTKVETVFTASKRLISSNWILKMIKKKIFALSFLLLVQVDQRKYFLKENSLLFFTVGFTRNTWVEDQHIDEF